MMAVRGSVQLQVTDPGEMFPLLESTDIHVAQEIKTEIQDSLNSGENWFGNLRHCL